MVAANDGNIFVKLSDNEFLCTPTGVSKGFMTPEYICKVDAKGNVISTNGSFKPSSEIKMHMRVYEKRPDVQAVVHAHPSFATAFAIAGIPLTQPIMPEAVIALGCVPIAEYGTPIEFNKEQIERLYEIRRQMGLPGKHTNHKDGKTSCHNCSGSCGHQDGNSCDEDIIAKITKEVLIKLNK